MSAGKLIPDENTIKEAAEVEILDSKGVGIKFGSVFENQKTVVVFIRHFFCGACQAYVQTLADVPMEALHRAGIKIVVIGCGEATVIGSYAETTHFAGEIYADPSRKLYHVLGMTIETFARTPKDQQRKIYLPNYVINVGQSIWRAISSPTHIGKQGNMKQLGGEFVFGPGNSCLFASQMQHTEDHVEVSELMAAAGVTYP